MPKQKNKKPSVAIFGLTSCEGCQFAILDLHEKFVELTKYLDIDEDTWLHLTIKDGKIVIEPVEKEKPRETAYKTVAEKSPAVDQEEYKTMIKEAKGSYGEKIVEENERVRKEIEERLEKLDL